jgi:hypothetical protein
MKETKAMNKLIAVLTTALVLAATSGCGKASVTGTEVTIDGQLYICYVIANDAAGTVSYNNCRKE